MEKIILWFLDRFKPIRIRYYVHEEKKFLYLFLPSENCTVETFRRSFPKAIEVTERKFDRIHFKEKVEIVLYGEDKEVDQFTQLLPDDEIESTEESIQ